MKKTIFSFAAALFIAGSMSAQIFVGGSIGFGTDGGSASGGSVSVNKAGEYSFNFNPYGGFYLNDVMAVGASIGFATNGYSAKQGELLYGSPVAAETSWSSNMFRIAPFVRYHLLEISNVTVLGEGYIGLGFGGSSSTTAGVTNDGPSLFEFSMGVRPGISYDFSESVAIEAFLGGLSFANLTKTTAANNNNPEQKDSDTSFDFSLTSHLSIGFVYKF